LKAVRAFVAIDLPAEVRDQIDEVTDCLKSRLVDVPIRWVPASNIHLTIKFLGDVSIANLEVLNGILQAEADRHTGFEISIGELGAYPSIHRPRVIWVGVEAPEDLFNLHSGIENETIRLGYPLERRPFSPHLTTGRVSRNASASQVRQIGGVLEHCTTGFLGAACINEIHLYRSDLRPTGAVYSRLISARFSKSKS